MRLRQFLRLIHPGVTRLFVESRRAGGNAMAIRAVIESAAALLIALRVSSTEPERQNAVRHFIWQARLTMARGQEFAATVGNLHEVGSPDRLDSSVDERNNSAGRSFATAEAERLAGLGTLAAYAELPRAALDHWRHGALWTKGPEGPVRSP